MTHAEFSMQVNRLVETYGKTHYGTERVTLIYQIVRDQDAAWMKRTVDDLIETHRQAPMGQDFRDAVARERERTHKPVKQIDAWDRPHDCTFCFDTGVFVCDHAEKGGLWAFRCPCDAGKRDERQQIPFFVGTHAADGFTWFHPKNAKGAQHGAL